ncbi:MAG: 5-(carboxyamino)imidazole ribonucleotide mutase [Acidimicrobiia bacterium]|nr:5-(carboxyamino)imidazole ribonucleotide mutase [Acidimicrobiia bacterium]
MGSDSDFATMEPAIETLRTLGIAQDVRVVSAHRTPEAMLSFGAGARDEGFRVIIAAAGGAAHLPGMLASVTTLPVIGVPVAATSLDGMDSLLSIVQMPAGIPVATMAIGGAVNAALMAARILAVSDPEVADALESYRRGLEEKARKGDEAVRRRLPAGDR